MSKIRSQKAHPRPRTRHLALATALVSISLSANAGLLANGGFETGDFSAWHTVGLASVVGSVGSPEVLPTDGNHQAMLITPSANAGATDALVGLPAGTIRSLMLSADWGGCTFGGCGPIAGSAMTQAFSASAYQSISFDWRLLTYEGPMGHLYDVPFVAVIGPGSIAVSLLRASDFSAAPESLAPASSADAYYPLVKSEVQTFTYRLPSAGEYTIGIGILSNWDTNNTSAILVDNVHASIPEPETLPLLGLGLAAFLSIRSLPLRRFKRPA